jgi:chorismate synthase
MGALAMKGIAVGTHILRCGAVSDRPFGDDCAAQIRRLESESFPVLSDVAGAMQAEIAAARSDGDSLGGIVQTAVSGLPAGVGEPWFDSLEGVISRAVFAIGGIKGIEFGRGFGFAELRGSEANDAFRMRDGQIRTATNRNGGVNGGISNGMPVVFRTVVKPTPSIYKEQRTVDYAAGQNASLSIKGRHDPCIVPRAAVVQNSLTAFGILDLISIRYGTLAQKHGLPH